MFRSRIELRNSRRTPVTVWFEPWAENLILENDALLHVESVSNQNEPLSIEIDDEAIVIFGMPGCISMKAYRDGQEVWKSFQSLPP